MRFCKSKNRYNINEAIKGILYYKYHIFDTEFPLPINKEKLKYIQMSDICPKVFPSILKEHTSFL